MPGRDNGAILRVTILDTEHVTVIDEIYGVGVRGIRLPIGPACHFCSVDIAGKRKRRAATAPVDVISCDQVDTTGLRIDIVGEVSHYRKRLGARNALCLQQRTVGCTS